MKILFITTQFPFPLNNGGKIGAYNGISVLQKFSEVTVLSFCEDIKEVVNYSQLAEKFDNVIYKKPIYHKVHIRSNFFRLASALISSYIRNIPYLASKFYDKKMLKIIDDEINRKDFDVIFIDYLNMAIYGDYIKAKYKDKKFKYVLKDHNIEYELFEQEAKKSRFLKRLIVNWQAKLTRQYEIEHVISADYVFTVCDDNVEKLMKYNKNTKAMKPTFRIRPFRERLTMKNNILFIGSLSWKQNIDGLQWFFDNVWQSVIESVPDATLYLVGNGGKSELFNITNVKYVGYVEDLNYLYEDAKVFIVPLLEGSGIRIKILEAFNNDVAVVSTVIGCETIGVEAEEIFKTDRPERFAEYIIELLQNDELNNNMRYRAKKFLESEYSLENRQKHFKKVFEEEMKVE